MTIRKGETWGDQRVPSPNMAVVHTDAELNALIRDGITDGPVGLLGGDMMRTLGGTGDRARFTGSEPIPHLPIDVVRVVFDQNEHSLFVAHLIARRSWWRGPLTAVMNAQFRGDWDVAPRSHPNDGKVDIVSVSTDLGLQQRWMARSRVRLGNHVPHPHISIVQRAAATIEFERPTSVTLDGVRRRSARRIDIEVEPDAITVCV